MNFQLALIESVKVAIRTKNPATSVEIMLPDNAKINSPLTLQIKYKIPRMRLFLTENRRNLGYRMARSASVARGGVKFRYACARSITR